MLILAPMQGLTGLPFRKAFHHTFGDVFDYAISPFISLTHGNLSLADKKIADVLPQNNAGSMPVVPQILGSEIPEFVDLANRLYEVGYTEANWNLGCPMPRVTRKTRGSGLLPYPDRVAEVLQALTKGTPLRISIKMRLGLNSENDIFGLIPVLNSFPIASITIHPRTAAEQYSGPLRLQCLQKVLPQIKHKIIFNGEINTLADYLETSLRFPEIHDFMIGRGAVADPLLPLKILNRNDYSDKALIITFLQNLCGDIELLHIPDKSKANKLKEYWGLMRKGVAKQCRETEKPLHISRFEDVAKSIIDIIDDGI